MPKTQLFIFDLDETLFNERDYVYSGFTQVSLMLKEYQLDPSHTLQELIDILEKKGRGQVFDTFLKNHHLYSKSLVSKCLQTYRQHKPKLTLYPDAERCLNRLNNNPLYLVTDGHKGVQKAKVKALGLDKWMKKCFITHEYGKKYAKPSPYCFLKICEREKIAPQNTVYIADDPTKDFKEIKPLGFQTVRILRGRLKDVKVKKEEDADRIIYTLDEL